MERSVRSRKEAASHMRHVTIKDIARIAGVSTSTVSRALSGSKELSEATRERIVKICNEQGYRVNALARSLIRSRTNVIGLIVPEVTNPFYAEVSLGIETHARQLGYNVMLCNSQQDTKTTEELFGFLTSHQVDGIILVGSNFIGTNEEENQYIKDVSAQVPIMLLNASFDYPNVYSTLCDDYTSMFEAAGSMLDAGIEDILYLYNSNSYSGAKKLGGFRAAMEAHSVPDYEKRILFYDGDPQQMDDVANYLERLSKKKLSFHGVIASEDPLAIGAMKYARRQGLRVPEDLSVIGYNNSMLTTCCTPELTSVDNRLETQTHQLVQTLLGVLQGEEMPKKSIFSGKLIKRGTTLF